MPEEFGSAEWSNPDYGVPLWRPPFPIPVTLAGIAWIGYGFLNFLNVVILVVLVAAMKPVRPDKAEALAGIVSCGACFPVLCGVAFTFVGAQSVRGTAKDILGNSIGSIVVGLFLVGLGLMQLGAVQLVLGVRPGVTSPAAQKADTLPAIINTACGVGLVAAGILALWGRSDYHAWRKSLKKATREDYRKRWNRNRREQEDDRDDEPRYRKRDGEDDNIFRF